MGAAIEDLYPERLAEHYEELAHHFTQGEEWAKAMAYSTLAGDRAAMLLPMLRPRRITPVPCRRRRGHPVPGARRHGAPACQAWGSPHGPRGA